MNLDLVICIMLHASVEYLGYNNPFRCGSQTARRVVLEKERNLAVECACLSVAHRQSYVNSPLGDRMTSLVFYGDQGALTCTVSSKLGDEHMQCIYNRQGRTCALQVPWGKSSRGMISSMPHVIRFGEGLALFDEAGFALFGPDDARLLPRDAYSYTNPTRIGNTYHL